MASNAAVAALLKPTYQHGRNNFPMDNKQVYSMKAGQITPVKCFHYEPETHLNIKAHDFTMTFPMQTAPFLRGRKEFSFYSVYYNAVWSLFNQYQGTRNDPKTSAFGATPTLQEPRMPLYSMFGGVFAQFVCYFFVEQIIPWWVRLRATTVPEVDANLEDNIRLAKQNFLNSRYEWRNAYRSLFTSYIPKGYDEDASEELLIELDDLGLPDFDLSYNDLSDDNGNYYSNAHYCQDIVGQYRVYNWIRKLDMLGYGNLYSVFRSMENALLEVMTGNASQAYAITQIVSGFGMLERKMFDLSYTYETNEGVIDFENAVPKYVNLYPICAYNSVFYHFFRNSYYDLDYDPHDYNLDFVSVDTTHGNYNILSMGDFSLRFLDIEYHQWKKDTFTGVLPDTQFGAVSSVEMSNVSISGVTDTDLSRHDISNNFGSISESGISDAGVYVQNVSSSKTSHLVADLSNSKWKFDYHTHALTGTGTSSFDVIALKRAEMLQDYRQQLMRAGNKTSDVFRAIYGGAPSSEHEDDVIPRFLETFGEDLFVDPVTATADTGNSNNGNLGDIASRGKFRGDSKEIKFNAGFNFGVIICFAYVVPTAEYNSYMYDKHIFELSPELHFIPQFENSGLEQILSDELNMLYPANEVHALGFGPRYYHKKSEVDMVHGPFCSTSDRYGSPASGWFGDFNNWVSPRTDMQARNSTSLCDFYINPSILDNIFVRAAGADQADDQFICNTYFEVNAVKAMSKVGLINFV